MSSDSPQENEIFVQQVIEEGSYRDRTEVLDEAVELFDEIQSRGRERYEARSNC